MAKRMLALVLALALTLSVTAVLASGIGTAATYSSIEPNIPEPNQTMYVYTDNGQGLNVRSAPFVGNNIIGLAPYRSEVQVIRFLDNGWACIIWNYGEAYVQSRYLQWYQPSPYYPVTPTPMPTRTPVTPTAAPYVPTDTLATLNAEFRTARFVTPFTVSVRPARASGWVNMRWAPSKDTEVIAQYRSGARLTVLAETQSWYQVEDPDSYATGFIMKAYVTKIY